MVIAVAVLISPTGASATCTATSSGHEICTQGTTSMLSGEGLWVLVPLSVPALACLLPAILPARWTGYLVAAALLPFCFLTGFSIGLFFLPVAVAAVVLATCWAGGARSRSSGWRRHSSADPRGW